ncbi:MAG: PLP-dependent transferase [Hyphomicrobiales bacterium]
MTSTKDDLSLATLFAQADGMVDPSNGAVVPAIQPATTFARDEQNQLVSKGHLYSRDDNDLARLAERILAKSEKADDGLLFPTGMAAVAAVLRTVPNGGRIIMQNAIYWGTTKWTREFCVRRQIELIEVDCSNLPELEEAAQPADVLWIETPSNPYLKTTDIRACSKIAKQIGAALVVDSTAATPVLSNPLAFGADIVMHSATKGINGHSDVLAGFLATANADNDLWRAIATDRHDAGAIIGTFEAWLLIRGMRTLPLRMERMCETAQAIAMMLETHSNVEAVLYPGLVNDKGHALAAQQMTGGFGCLVSFLVKGGKQEALAVAGQLKLFKRATSLGGVESLVEHRHTVEPAIDGSLLRLSVGIESADDLLADLEQALTVL